MSELFGQVPVICCLHKTAFFSALLSIKMLPEMSTDLTFVMQRLFKNTPR